jgi:hypothetical protein
LIVVPFKNIMVLVVALFVGCIASSAFSQEACEGVECRQPLPAMIGEVTQTSFRVATAPVRAVATVVRNRPVRTWASSRPVRRVLGGLFRCNR